MELAMTGSEIVELSKLPAEYMDRGTYFGDGVYEVLRSYEGKLFALDEHLERFKRSLEEIHIENVDIEDIKSKIIAAYGKSAIKQAKIYFHITRGCHLRSHLPCEDLKPAFFMTITELPYQNHEDPVPLRLATHPDWRWKRCDIKSLNLLANVLARIYAGRKGCDEALLIDEDGFITEGAASAFFIIEKKDSALLTRPLGPAILPSITRNIIAQICENAGLKFVEQPITPDRALRADEAFVAVTTTDITPVSHIDSKPVSAGDSGELTLKLKNEFLSEVYRRLRIS